MKKTVAAVFLGLLMLLGCGNEATERMSSGRTQADWPERSAIDAIVKPVGMIAGMGGDWKKAQKELDAAALSAALDALAASTAPDGYDQNMVDGVLTAGKALAEAKDSDFETEFKAFTDSLSRLNLQ